MSGLKCLKEYNYLNDCIILTKINEFTINFFVVRRQVLPAVPHLLDVVQVLQYFPFLLFGDSPCHVQLQFKVAGDYSLLM